MNDTRLYLDGELVSIDPSTVITETRQINNLFELKDRQTDYTNNFTLLLDNETSNILDKLGNTYNTSLKPYRLLNPKLYRGGTPTIVDGKFIIQKITDRKKLTGSVQSGNVSFYDAMGTSTLADLDLSELEHTFSTASILSTFGNTWEDGYIYALSNFGSLDVNSIDFTYQPASVFMKYLFEQLFIQNGFTWSYRGDDNPLDSEHFKTRLLTLNKGFAYDDTLATAYLIIDLEIDGEIDANSSYYVPFVENIDTENIHEVSNNGSIIDFNKNAYYRLDIEGTLQVGDRLLVYERGTVLKEITADGSFSDTIYSYFDVYSNLKFEIKTSESTTYDLSVKIYENDGINNVNFSNYLGSMKQKDFFKMVLQMYGLMTQKKKGTNEMEFYTMSEMFLNREGAQDMSDKYHNERLISETFRFGVYGQSNFMRYLYDDDEADFADGDFYIDDETLNETKDMFVFPCKAPRYSEQLFNFNFLYDTILYDVETDDNGNVTNVKPKSTKPYIGSLTRIDGSFDYELSIENETGSYTGNIPIFTFKNQNFDYLISKYYAGFVATMNRTKVHDVELELLPRDVANFDFFRLVYLRQEQKYYYCNKIMGYRENKVTKVQLIEVNTSSQTYGEYSDDYNNDYNI